MNCMKGSKKALKALVKHFGSQKHAAQEFDCTQQAIAEWFKNGIPVDRAVEAERKTNRCITKEQLRPDIFRNV
jgi:predicted transcriptional regulator